MNSSNGTNKVQSTEIDLKNVLSSTIAGQDILDNFAINKVLREADQTIIARLVVEQYQLRHMKMDPSIMRRAAKAIVELFPTEVEATYYIPRSQNIRPSGKLYDRYFNTYKTNKKPTSTEEPPPKKMRIENCKDNPNYDVFLKQKSFLQFNTPANLKKVWEETSKLRMQESKDNLENVFKNWPRYKDLTGLDLINIDFQTLYPNKSNLLFEKIETFVADVCKIFPSLIKDKLNMNLFDTLNKCSNWSSGKEFQSF